jgi:hypothetical protein
LLFAWTAGADEPSRARPTPLRFESEIVRLLVNADSLTVEGIYVLSCDPDRTGFTTLLYPYPDDPRLGGARTLELACRVRPDPVWQPAAYRELPHNLGAHWRLPLAPGDTLEVRTVYRQALHEAYARYIVTTVHGWRHPLRRARFEIMLPPDAEPTEFSFPFAPCDSLGPSVYCYEATDFRPDKDIEVRWR